MQKEAIDYLVIAAHPDDAELCCGGAISKAVRNGKKVAIVDCTRGELGSRGTVDIRRQEAQKAASILAITERRNLGIEDGNIEHSKKNILKVVTAIRYFQPQILLFPPERDRHPDHDAAHVLVKSAVFQSGLPKIRTEIAGQVQTAHRPKLSLCYMQSYEFVPSFFLDISDEFEQKLKSIRAYSSQFFVEDENRYSEEPETFISRPEFLAFVEDRARYFGAKIGVKYAEAFYSIDSLGVRDLAAFL